MIDPKSVFDKTLSIQSQTMKIHNLDTNVKHDIKVAPSNYARNLAGPEEIAIEGKEFVVSKTSLDAANYGTLKRGHKIIDSDLGINTISEIREMVIMGVVVGYRLRTS